ncbi:MAG TPA: aldo/keto reductase [Tepidisphaeraceae bacterium]|jgi:aryl-alcohol dehydrogenase-like predicted oxidoreductase
MQYRTFGRMGWKVSEIGFGGWAIGGSWGPQQDEDSLAALSRALDLGCNFIDTAQGYGDGRSERIIAQVLKQRGSTEKVYVATKIPPAPGAWPPSPYDRAEERYPEAYLRQRLERSLRDLQTDAIDLLQLHTWTRAWNAEPRPLEILRKFQKEGKIRAIGISTPEHDQNSLVQLMNDRWLDAVQVIYNIFEQEPQAEFFPTAKANDVGVIVRVPFDESALTGKLTPKTKFAEGDFRNNYFAGDRLMRTIERVEKAKAIVGDSEKDLPTAALKFCLKPGAVSTVIPGMRNVDQVNKNLAVSDERPMSDETERALRAMNWLRAFWYGGK